MGTILILYYSRHGNVATMANYAARGVEQVDAMQAIIRTVPAVSATCEAIEDAIPSNGAPYASLDELAQCNGLLVGSPNTIWQYGCPIKIFF